MHKSKAHNPSYDKRAPKIWIPVIFITLPCWDYFFTKDFSRVCEMLIMKSPIFSSSLTMSM